MARIKVFRYNPERDEAPTLQEYQVPLEEGENILQALNYIYEELDSTLAFRFGCRYRRCGLCALEVDGRPRLACMTPLRDSITLRPLSNLPLVRDLTVDRAWLFRNLARLQLWVPSQPNQRELRRIMEPEEHLRLMGCTECLACLPTCPSYHYNHDSYGGAYYFVKLAQLHFHPLNQIDRRAQAYTLGVERCASCRKCWCPLGIPIYRLAISPLLTAKSP